MFDLPLSVRLSLVWLLGVVIATQLNRGIYRLAWFSRSIGPWSPPHADAPARQWYDRLPILGWWFLRRESRLHGRGFWVRPLLIELLAGFGLAYLYWYEIDQVAVVEAARQAISSSVLRQQFFAHLVLFSLMTVATFIDFDEQTIPDAITVPGALIGLSIAALLPESRPLITLPGNGVEFLHVASGAGFPPANVWPAWLNGIDGLLLGGLAFLAWWLAILPWTWTVRRGLLKAVRYFAASLWRRTDKLHLVIAGGGLLAIAATWGWGGVRWESLFSALTGLVFGGGFVWAVRAAGSRALGQEALGFGDVTLMAMIGTFTGWQATLMIFFLAPVAAMFIALAQWLLTGRKDIAFGPYLCLATVFVVVRWGWLWENWGRAIFALGWFVPAIVAFCVVLIWAMLTVMRFFRELGDDDHDAATEEAVPESSEEATRP